MHLNLGEIGVNLASQSAEPAAVAFGYSIDSRTLMPGQLFFAIRGPRFDGHRFVLEAMQRGAVGAVIERGRAIEIPQQFASRLIEVTDTTQALQSLGNAVRRKWGKRLVGITGSTGKTTTKEMIAAALGKGFSVRKSRGNFNNTYGLPLTLLSLEQDHEVAVLELGMSAPGELALLTRIAEPQVGVVTNVGPVHLEFFDSVDAIAEAKRELLENLAAGATAVLNNDDERVKRFRDGFEGYCVTFGFTEGSDFRVVDLALEGEKGSRFRVVGREFDGEFFVPLPGRHNTQNAAAAIATASLFGIPVRDIAGALGNFHGIHQRSEVLHLGKGITVVNDCYNSNPPAMEYMLETLADWKSARRRILVAGEMLELGPTSAELHREVGRKCAKVGLEWLLAVQGDAAYFLKGAVESGFPTGHGEVFADASAVPDFLCPKLQSGDVVLIKGSRGVHLETVTQALIAKFGHPSNPNPLD
jgi:UDP-N-acetylmuramoyl-tripeptide--D-alanyl-D-alanine ligase